MKSLITRKIDHFDIQQICESGQCFRMQQKAENTYSIVASGHYLEISKEGWPGNKPEVRQENESEGVTEWSFRCGGGEEEFEGFWKEYFDLETDYGAYIARINPKELEAFPVDTHIKQALTAHYPRGFPKRRYKGFEGVMQQYMFYWELSHARLSMH